MRLLIALVALLLLALAGLNTQAGFLALQSAASLAGVTVTGLGGRFPDRLTADEIGLDDAQGRWLTLRQALLDWRPSALLHGEIAAVTVQADTATVARWPTGGSDGGTTRLPPLAIDRLQIDHVILPEATLSISGAARLGDILALQLDLASADAAGTGPASVHAILAGPRSAAHLDATVHAADTDLTAAGTLDLEHLTGQLTLATRTALHLPGPRPDLLGPDPATLDLRYGPDLSLDLHTATARLSLRTRLPALAADWRLVLPNLTALDPSLAGTATLAGRIAGKPDNLTATATLDAHLATGPVAGTVTLRGLPTHPVAALALQGSWNGTDIAIAAGAARSADGVIHLAVPQAQARGVTAQAVLALDPAQPWPTGRIALQSPHLPSVDGSAEAMVTLTAQATGSVSAEAHDLAFAGVSLGTAHLAGTATDLLSTPRVKLQFDATPVRSGAVSETLRLSAEGPAQALALVLEGTGTATLQAAGLLDSVASRLTLSALQIRAQGPPLRLTAPARLDYADGLTLDRLRLDLGPARLDLAGRLAPVLNVTGSLHALNLSSLRAFAPTPELQGTLSADATMRGTMARPEGVLRLSASGLRMIDILPPATLTATATLAGTTARLDAAAAAGPTSITLAGTVPLGAGAYDLRAHGTGSLAQLDPLLAPSGQQARGQLTLDATLTGPAPSLAGHLTLTGGSFRDASQGLAITDLTASAHADDTQLVLDSLTGRAGGTITAAARLGLAAPQPLTASLTAHDITPLTSDALSARLSAALAADGALATGVTLRGRIDLARADIRIPDRLPARLPTLPLRQAPAPPRTAPPIGLDITLNAPGQMFLRGRGIDAELAGRLHLGGSAADPIPQGGFTLRRGQVALAGQTLTFTAGKVSLDGHLPIDPTLDFTARAQGSNVVATLEVTGTASRPRIALSSVPALPQDEVLAQLLFHQSAASLGPLQIAQIATGLAQLADLGGAGAFDPLGVVRQRLGLDTLSIGGQPGGQTVVEGGRSIAKGVTLGARQAVGGVGTQATVRVDLARGLRLEADVGVAPPAAVTQGAAPTGNQVAVTYEFEY